MIEYLYRGTKSLCLPNLSRFWPHTGNSEYPPARAVNDATRSVIPERDLSDDQEDEGHEIAAYRSDMKFVEVRHCSNNEGIRASQNH